MDLLPKRSYHIATNWHSSGSRKKPQAIHAQMVVQVRILRSSAWIAHTHTLSVYLSLLR